MPHSGYKAWILATRVYVHTHYTITRHHSRSDGSAVIEVSIVRGNLWLQCFTLLSPSLVGQKLKA